MDLALSRLSVGNCADTLPGDTFRLRDGAQTLREDNRAWRQLVTQMSPAIAPAILAPVTTGGPMGFDVSLETNVTKIDSGADYWARGSRGSGPDAVPTCDGRNHDVNSALTSNRLHFVKGLPFGFSIGAAVGKLYTTNLWIVGGEIKLALIEGLRTLPVPDLAVRGAVNTTVGSAPYTLTSVAADLVLSKNLVAGRTVQLSPYGGAGFVITFANSELVDLTPNVDAVKCAAGEDPLCNAHGLGASADDIGHDRPFKDLSLTRYRGFLGLAMRYAIFTLAAEFVVDLTVPRVADKAAGRGTPRQWTFNVAPGFTF